VSSFSDCPALCQSNGYTNGVSTAALADDRWPEPRATGVAPMPYSSATSGFEHALSSP
jgi:hypothetical protein